MYIIFSNWSGAESEGYRFIRNMAYSIIVQTFLKIQLWFESTLPTIRRGKGGNVQFKFRRPGWPRPVLMLQPSVRNILFLCIEQFTLVLPSYLLNTIK